MLFTKTILDNFFINNKKYFFDAIGVKPKMSNWSDSPKQNFKTLIYTNLPASRFKKKNEFGYNMQLKLKFGASIF